MKRSEAILKLAELLPQILSEYEESTLYVDSTPHRRIEWLADDLINYIENHSIMVPPEIQYWNRDENGKLQFSVNNGDYLNVWEKE